MKLKINEKARLIQRYGEWAIVTGASSGIGFELASQLADAGFHLLLNARNERRLSEASQKLMRKNIEIRCIAADVSHPSGVEKIIHASRGLNVGLLINNAGYGTSGVFVGSSLHAEINMLRVNCEAVLSLTHYFAQQFIMQKRGGMIFLSSLVAFQGVPYAAHYAATKAYVQTFAEALARELKPLGVDVLAAAPGPVTTAFGQRANMKMDGSSTPDQIGAPILSSLGKTFTVIPGLRSKVLMYALRTVPRSVKIQIMQAVMGGFTRHQRQGS